VLWRRPGFVSGKMPLASVQAISANTTSQLQLIPMRIPRMRPSGMLVVTSRFVPARLFPDTQRNHLADD
jgi:hypothetical protein